MLLGGLGHGLSVPTVKGLPIVARELPADSIQCLKEVDADFPDLTIVMAHPAVPWVDAQISIATHKANVYLDLSGWSPKYFPPQLVRAAGSLLKRKVLFGSDYPVITPDRWLADFAQLDLKDEVRPLILKDNAVAVLQLDRQRL